MNKLAGGCLCGVVRYDCSASEKMTLVCHCVDCQKQTGTAFSVLVAVPTSAFEIRGDSLRCWATTGDSGQEVARWFCNTCGSPLYSQSPLAPGLVMVKAGTLDDRSWLQPRMHVWCCSKQPWVELGSEQRQFERSP